MTRCFFSNLRILLQLIFISVVNIEFIVKSPPKKIITEAISNWNYSYPGLRVAYIDEVEEREGDKVQKVFYSVLVKALDNHDQVSITTSSTSPFPPFQTYDASFNNTYTSYLCEGNIPYKTARTSKIRWRQTWKSKSCDHFYTGWSSPDYRYESGELSSYGTSHDIFTICVVLMNYL